MPKRLRAISIILTACFLSLICTPTFARPIQMKDAGVAVWILFIIGAIIILLQLIPAAILFFAFIGTITGLVAKKKALEKIAVQDSADLMGYEPIEAKG